LNGGGAKDVVVYLTGERLCASGGCTTLVLAPKGGGYEVVSRIVLSQLPIRVMATRSHGWRDLELSVADGSAPGTETRLSYDGKSYPANPSLAPAVPLNPSKSATKAAGMVAIPITAAGTPLYRQ
jgi:hypothetical protein